MADSGVWQHLSVDELSVGDLCQLIGMASDNLATNVLLARVGLAGVAASAAGLGLVRTGLHDRVRDVRLESDPPTLSTGSAGELVRLMIDLPPLVLGWLGNGLDLSQVAAGWGLDPLAHQDFDLGLRLVNKTGTDDGVRADVGVLTGPTRRIGYAVVANWDNSPDGPPSGVAAATRSRPADRRSGPRQLVKSAIGSGLSPWRPVPSSPGASSGAGSARDSSSQGVPNCGPDH